MEGGLYRRLPSSFLTTYKISLFNAPIRSEVPLEELFEACYECRSNKRWSANAMTFEMNYEQELLQLCREVNEGTYRVGRSIAFIVERFVCQCSQNYTKECYVLPLGAKFKLLNFIEIQQFALF